MCPAVLLRKGEMDIPTCLENGARRDTPETGYPGENWGPAKRGRGRRPPQILLYFLSLKCCECMAYSKCISRPKISTNVASTPHLCSPCLLELSVHLGIRTKESRSCHSLPRVRGGGTRSSLKKITIGECSIPKSRLLGFRVESEWSSGLPGGGRLEPI